MAVVATVLGFAHDNRAAADFIHAAPYTGLLARYADRVAADKDVRMDRISAWLRPHIHAGRVVRLPDPLIEMLVIGPVAELTRRWLAGVPGIDLARETRLLPERIWQSIRGYA